MSGRTLGGRAPIASSHTRSRIVLASFLVFLAWLSYRLFVLKPSNQRDWEIGMDRLPRITIHEGAVTVQDVRDFRYSPEGTRALNYVDRTFQVDRIERVWFVKEPFTIAPFSGFGGTAHTYFVFDFADQPPLAISVEARREKGESYNPLAGLVNQFELIYIWASEQDVTVRRAIVEQRELYMYPLTISVEAERTLFLQLAEASRDLESHPRFYNTLTNNCTSELARAANRVKPGAIPPNIALVFPGYSDELLYERGFFPNDVSLDQLTRRSAISDIVRATYEREDFSRALRMELASRG